MVRRCSLTCTYTAESTRTTRSRQAADHNYTIQISQGRGHEDKICKEMSAESTCRWREGVSNSIARAELQSRYEKDERGAYYEWRWEVHRILFGQSVLLCEGRIRWHCV